VDLERAKNKLCMDNELTLYYTIRMYTENFAHLLRKCFHQHYESLPTRMFRWNAQSGTDMILNVDGSSIGNPGVSGFGGLIRNSDGT
jgi:hypothetical protein